MGFIEDGLGDFFTFRSTTREGQWTHHYYYAHGVATRIIYNMRYNFNTPTGQKEAQMKHWGKTGECKIAHKRLNFYIIISTLSTNITAAPSHRVPLRLWLAQMWGKRKSRPESWKMWPKLDKVKRHQGQFGRSDRVRYECNTTGRFIQRPGWVLIGQVTRVEARGGEGGERAQGGKRRIWAHLWTATGAHIECPESKWCGVLLWIVKVVRDIGVG